jgi:hypothetical protein
MSERESAIDLAKRIHAKRAAKADAVPAHNCWACGKPTDHFVTMLGRYVCDDCSPIDRESPSPGPDGDE